MIKFLCSFVPASFAEPAWLTTPPAGGSFSDSVDVEQSSMLLSAAWSRCVAVWWAAVRDLISASTIAITLAPD